MVRKLLVRNLLIVVLKLALSVHRFSLARATGPFPSTSAEVTLCLVKVNDRETVSERSGMALTISI